MNMVNCKHDLNPQQRAALVATLQVAAHGEVIAEHTRRCLCNNESFDPSTLFRNLQFAREDSTALGAEDFYAWLRQQQLGVPNLSIDDVLAAIAPFSALGRREVPYQGFLRMILPQDDPKYYFRDSRLRAPHSDVVPEVALLFGKLMSNEIEVTRRLKTHQNTLSELGVTRAGVLSFFNSGDNMYAEDLVSPSALRRVLMDRFRYLDRQQCEALIRRINPSSSCLSLFDDLAHIVGPLDQMASIGGLGSRERLPVSLPDNSPMNPSDGSSSMPPDQGGFLASAAPCPGRDPPKTHSISPSKSGRLAVSWSPELLQSTVRSSLDQVHSTQSVEPRLGVTSVLAGNGVHVKEEEKHCRDDLGLRRGVSKLHFPVRALQESKTWSSSLDGRARESRSQNIPPEYLSPRVILSSGMPVITPDTMASTRASTMDVTSPQSALQPKHLSWDVKNVLPSPRKPTTRARSTSSVADLHVDRTPFYSNLKAAPTAVACSLAGKNEVHAPRSGQTPHNTSFAPDVVDEDKKQRAIQVVFQIIAQQATFDVQLERAKACLPARFSIESVFKLLDLLGKGYVAATDLLHFCRGFGSVSTLQGLCALVKEVQLRHPAGSMHISPNRLSLRELGTLLLPMETQAHDEVVIASSDAEALSVLYVLRNSEPCPGCGARIQRDADATGCPMVSCPLCGTTFQCNFAVSLVGLEEPCSVSAPTQFHLFKLLDIAAQASAEIEKMREQVALLMQRNVTATLTDAFASISGERPSFTSEDLQRALCSRGLSVSEEELGFLWRRYAPAGHGTTAEASFPHFARHLQPRAPPIRVV